jgi:hypothetical protein
MNYTNIASHTQHVQRELNMKNISAQRRKQETKMNRSNTEKKKKLKRKRRIHSTIKITVSFRFCYSLFLLSDCTHHVQL